MTGALIFLGILVAGAAVGAAGVISELRFGEMVKRNRAAGLYDDPSFEREIGLLQSWRTGLRVAEVLALPGAAAVMVFGSSPLAWFGASLAVILGIAIALAAVDRRWQKLMREGAKNKDEG